MTSNKKYFIIAQFISGEMITKSAVVEALERLGAQDVLFIDTGEIKVGELEN